MAALDKIRMQAVQLEQDRHYEKALAAYGRLFDEAGPGEELDVGLYNRAGDVALRAGQPERAVQLFERALDRYAAGGLLSNAIAVGVKILRHAPAHVAAHHTLGVLYARKGFRSDARHHLLAYADHMHRGGQDEEAARALGEFAALADGPAAARAELARHLAAAPAPDPAPGAAPDTSLTALLERTLGASDGDGADGGHATAAGGRGASSDALGDLVFLDMGFGAAAEPAPVELAPSCDDAPVAEAPPDEAWSLAPVAPRWTVALPGEPAPLAVALLDRAAAGEPAGVSDDLALDLAPELACGMAGDAVIDGEGELPLWLVPPDGELAPVDEGCADGGALDLELFLPEPEAAVDAAAARLLAGPVPSVERAYAPAEVDAPLDGLEMLELDAVDGPPLAVPPVEGEAATPVAEVPDDVACDVVCEVALDEPAAIAIEHAPAPSDEALDLGAWLRATEPATSTRMTAPAPAESGDEDQAFAEALRAFRTSVARAVPDADHDSHYDLGVAYREMGLLDEAIHAFQRAARAPGLPLRALESLGQAFLDRGEPALAQAALARAARALDAPGPLEGDASTVGLCYLVASAAERLGQADEARRWYVRVLALDYSFRDAAARLASLPPSR